MANQSFDVNSRHVMNVAFNGANGLCDVVVSDKQTNLTFSRSMVLDKYNQVVDWLRDNDHGFAMMSIRSYF